MATAAATAVVTRIQTLSETFIPAPTRARLLDAAHSFALARPYLASYLVLLALFSLLPLLGLVVFLVILLSIGVFCIGVALCILSGFLLLAAAFATACWAYAVGCVLVARLVFNMFSPQPQPTMPAPRAQLCDEVHPSVFKREKRASPMLPMTSAKVNGVTTPTPQRRRSSSAKPKYEVDEDVSAGEEVVGDGAGDEREEREGRREMEKLRRDVSRSLK